MRVPAAIRLFQCLLSRRRPPRPEPDAADMGTAFGLEMAFADDDHASVGVDADGRPMAPEVALAHVAPR